MHLQQSVFCLFRFSFAAVPKFDKDRSRFEFHGPPRLWNGKTIKSKIKGNSVLYILEEEVHGCFELKYRPFKMKYWNRLITGSGYGDTFSLVWIGGTAILAIHTTLYYLSDF